MKTVYAYFASPRYWRDPDRLAQAYTALKALFPCEHASLITSEEDLAALEAGDCLVLMPMSGAVQKLVITAAARYPFTVIMAPYIRGNAPEEFCTEMLRSNAAPTFMDAWAVLRRTHPCAMYATDREGLYRALRVGAAVTHVRAARILLIGDTEPWVISNAADLHAYEQRFGLQIRRVPQSELAELYQSTTPEEAHTYRSFFAKSASGCVEPTAEDLQNAARMTAALLSLLRRYDAQGCAIACFNLLKEGTTACLGVSYINTCTDMVAACEGDVDSAVTMLLMKKLTDSRLWMANPGLQPGGTVNFSHCTAPLCIRGEDTLPCTLRSHHESGIGVSLQLEMPVGEVLTACRVSDDASKITVMGARSVSGPYECACRTQMHVEMEDARRYLDTALGCHQIFAFGDIRWELTELARIFGLEIL